MPQGATGTTIHLLGKDREFRATLGAFRRVKEKTKINMMRPESADEVQNNLDILIPALLFYGIKDKADIPSIEDLEDELDMADLESITKKILDSVSGGKEKNGATTESAQLNLSTS